MTQQRTRGIRTYSGLIYYHDAPTPAMICIEDIAHSLSNLCRFAGHTKKFYAVAEHSVRVSYMCPPGLEFEGLHHDDSETYVVDLPSPLKHLPNMHEYRSYEKNGDSAIRLCFGLLPVEPAIVKEMDTKLCKAEQRDLIYGPGDPNAPTVDYPTIKPWSARKAKRRFLMRHYELSGKSKSYRFWTYVKLLLRG